MNSFADHHPLAHGALTRRNAGPDSICGYVSGQAGKLVQDDEQAITAGGTIDNSSGDLQSGILWLQHRVQCSRVSLFVAGGATMQE